MKRTLLLPTLLVLAPAASAQDAWTAYVDQVRERAKPRNRWTLAVPSADKKNPAWQDSDAFLRLDISQEFDVSALPEPALRDLWQAKGWQVGSLHWVLLSPEGVVVKEGAGLPEGTALLSDLKSAGFQPPWERLEAFLKEHPDHGEARGEALSQAFSLGLRRAVRLRREGRIKETDGPSPAFSFATPEDPSGASLATATFAEAADHLEALLELEGWTEWIALPFLTLQFVQSGVLQSPRLLALSQRMLMDLSVHCEREPHAEFLWMTYGGLVTALRQDPLAALGKVVPVPDQAWPPNTMLGMGMEGFAERKDWEGALAFLDGLPAPSLQGMVSEAQWRSYGLLKLRLHLHRARALAGLNRWTDVQTEVTEVRRWGGSRWKGMWAGLLRRLIPALVTEQKATFEPLLNEEPLPDPPLPPAPEPARLALLGPAPWRSEWDRLRRQAALQAWAPGELTWGGVAAEAERALRTRHGWGPEPRWVLLQGESLQASGDTLPTAEALGNALQGAVPSRLQRLNLAVQSAPHNLALRRARAEWLLARMPNGHLEVQLAEDARLSRMRLVLPENGWKPNPELWQWAAQKVLPEVERELKLWPSRTQAWRVWLSWAALHPQHPSPLALARSLAIWGNEQTWGSRLPNEIHAAVAEELRRSGQFEPMRAWFQDAWDGLVPPTNRPQPRWFLEQRRERADAIAKPLREALVALRRDAEVVALDKALAALRAPEGRRAGS